MAQPLLPLSGRGARLSTLLEPLPPGDVKDNTRQRRQALQLCERERPDDRLVDLMIAAESLFLGGEDNPIDRGELRYRLELRAACFIDSKDYSQRKVFNHMRRAYDGRSAIVHGSGEPKPSTLKSPKHAPMSLHDFSELTAGLLRIALKKSIDVAAGSKGAKGPLLDWSALIIPS
jgi:Apea-like HEPN